MIRSGRHVVIPGDFMGVRVRAPASAPAAAPNLLLNGSFSSDTANWTASNATLSSVAGGQVGNCLQVLNTAAANGYAYQAVAVTSGISYTATVYHYNGGGPSPRGGQIRIGAAAGSADFWNLITTDAAWTQKSTTFTPNQDTIYVSLVVDSASAAKSTWFDEVVLTLT